MTDRDERARFRADVRAWLDEHAPAKGSPEDFSAIHVVSAATAEEFEAREAHALAVTRGWQRQLHDAGWAGRDWPVDLGGHGGPRWQAEAVAEETARYGVSTKMLSVALEMAAPVLLAHGTPAQCRAHLPRIVTGEEAWCQLLSEPDAGSDLTAVATTAVPDGDGWVVQGQKVWTSGAGSADFALLLARSERGVAGAAGLSFFALPMDQPGVVVRPLRQISGGYHFNEVFLDGARLPAGSRIGEAGRGFTVLRSMLASERAAIGGGTSARSATQLRAMAAEVGRSADPHVRQVLARAHTRERLLDLLLARGEAVPALGPLTKLAYSEHARLSADAALGVLGAAGALVDDDHAGPWVDRFLFAPGLRIGGGTDEIQRNTIAERALGLPREPRPR